MMSRREAISRQLSQTVTVPRMTVADGWRRRGCGYRRWNWVVAAVASGAGVAGTPRHPQPAPADSLSPPCRANPPLTSKARARAAGIETMSSTLCPSHKSNSSASLRWRFTQARRRPTCWRRFHRVSSILYHAHEKVLGRRDSQIGAGRNRVNPRWNRPVTYFQITVVAWSRLCRRGC